MTASSRTQALLVGTSGKSDSMYLYKYYWSGDKKIQNSWSRWDFPGADRLHWACFGLDFLYILVRRGRDLCLEKMQVNEETYSIENRRSRICLDRRVTKSALVFAYDEIRNVTTVTYPYETDAELALVYSGNGKDRIWPVATKVSSNTIQVSGDIRNYSSIVGGVVYTMLYTFSTPYVRMQRPTGGDVVSNDGRLQMRYIQIEYHDSSVFKVKLDVPGRAPVWKTVDVKTADQPGSVFDMTTTAGGFARVPVMGLNTNISVSIINDTPFSAAFGGAEWTALYTPKTRRMG